MKRRRLRPDEEELWRKVVSNAERLHPEKPLKPEDFVTTPASQPRQKARFQAMPRTVPATPVRPETTTNLLPGIADRIGAQPVQMDRKSFNRMKKGKLRPEGKLDLHGLTLERAHPALTRFIMTAQQDGKRLVLVVTGKGKQRDEGGPIPVRFGILRHQVPHWLSTPPLSAAILQVTQAHMRHGGNGAYYVYLRKAR